MGTMPSEPTVQAIRKGDVDALARFFTRHRERLRRMVLFRLHPRLKNRLDPDDVLQEVYLDAVRRIEHCKGEDEGTVYVWLRLIAQQTLIDAHRRHLGAAARDAGREVRIDEKRARDGISVTIADGLLAQRSTPSRKAVRREEGERLAQAIEGMEEIDREVIALRHFEDLSNAEVARVLGIEPKAASARYVRALRRLREILEQLGIDSTAIPPPRPKRGP